MKFPKELYVTVEYEGTEDEFLLTNKNVEDVAQVGETVKVAVYELVRTVEVDTEIQVTEK